MAIHPFCRDFTLLLQRDLPPSGKIWLALLLGNTLANLEPPQLGSALRWFSELLGPGARLVVGMALPVNQLALQRPIA
jgi:hypothetical protein